jgi:hypothetical protein
MLDMDVGLMDIYTLARMFRYSSKRVIVYAGATHTRRYVEFFEKYLHVTVKKYPPDLQQVFNASPTKQQRCVKVNLSDFLN